MTRLKTEEKNGVAYFKFGDNAPFKHTLPIDSIDMLFTPSGTPVAFRIIKSNLVDEWMDSWEEISPDLYDKFEIKLKELADLRFEKGFYWFSDIPGDGLVSIAASAYVDFDAEFDPQGVEFLFQAFDK